MEKERLWCSGLVWPKKLAALPLPLLPPPRLPPLNTSLYPFNTHTARLASRWGVPLCPYTYILPILVYLSRSGATLNHTPPHHHLLRSHYSPDPTEFRKLLSLSLSRFFSSPGLRRSPGAENPENYAFTLTLQSRPLEILDQNYIRLRITR